MSFLKNVVSEHTLPIAFAGEECVREFIVYATNNQLRPPSPASPLTAPTTRKDQLMQHRRHERACVHWALPADANHR